MKSILFIVPTNTCGGTNSSLSSIVDYLKKSYDIKILVVNPQSKASYKFMDNALSDIYLQAFYGSFFGLSNKIKLFSLLIKVLKRFSIFCSFDIESFICKTAAYRIGKKYNFYTVVGFQEGLSMRIASYFNCSNKVSWLHCDYSRIVDSNDLIYYRKFDRIVAVSEYTLNIFLNIFPELKIKSTYLHNLLDSKRIYTLSQFPIDDIRFKIQDFTILSVGRMDSIKQFSQIPKIAKYMMLNNVQFHWYIIGGPENHEFLQVQREIEKNNVSDVVILLGTKTNPYPYFKAANILVSTSKSEACPMVFIEAKLCGIPIISSDFGSAYEFINDGIDGFIRPISMIGDILIKVIKDDRLYSSLKVNINNYSIQSSEPDEKKLEEIIS